MTKLSIVFGITLLFAHSAEAASLFLTPSSGEYGMNKEITVDLKIDSEGTGVNATQATIRFPKDIVNVKSIDKTNSTLSFWLEEPTFSNEDGVISFVGGTPYGVSGASLQILHIVFTTKGSGPIPINIIDAAVTASDGSGTNVLSKTTDASFTIAPTTITPVAIVPPTQITRAPSAPSGLPVKPTLNVPLYASAGEWYNHSNTFTASWTLPRDITGVATALNKDTNYKTTLSEGLFDSKMFPALSDGVWYLHVRFNNNIGWGETAHYRIAVDTQTPIPFEITSKDSESTDNPTPMFAFKTSDALSGIREYRIRVDQENWTTIPLKSHDGTYKLTNQNPGKHRLTIQAVDSAGNSIENGVDYETLAIASPTFTFVTEKLFSDEPQGLTLKGTSIPGTQVLVSIKQGATLITSNTIVVDPAGNWEYSWSDPLRNGTYRAQIRSRDARGALSLIVDSPEINVTGKYTNAILVTFMILAGMLLAGVWYTRRRNSRIAIRVGVAESDASKVFNMIGSDIEKIKTAQGTPTPADDEFLTNKLAEKVEKMSGYIEDEIKRAKE